MHEFDKGIGIIEDRRVAQRHKIELKSSILMTAINNSAETKKPPFVLQGQLLDVSLSGLAMTISFNDMVELKLLGEDLTLHLLLPLPVQAIELDATPVRYALSDQSGTGRTLLGARITNMNGRDRVLFMDFINQF